MKFKSRKDKKTKGLIYGYGINDSLYKPLEVKYHRNEDEKIKREVVFSCYIFKSWKWMLRRVFIDKGYEDCKIQEDWLLFSNYFNWYVQNIPNSNQNYVIDKDLLSNGRSCYSENTCLFVPKRINDIISKAPAKKSTSLIGTYLDNSRSPSRWQGYYTINGKRDMKSFSSEYEAHSHWRLGCISNIKREIDKISSGDYGNLSNCIVKELYGIIENMTYTMIQAIPFKGFNLTYNNYIK